MKTNFKKRILATASIASVLLLAACGNEAKVDNADNPEEDITEETIGSVGAMEDFDVGDTFVATEPLDISILYRDMPTYPYDSDWRFFEVLEEEHNVNYEAVVVPLSDYEERRSVTVSAGDMPDYATDTWPGDESAFVPSGVLLPISDYVHLMPHFQKRVEEWELEDELDTIRYLDGKYYVLPGLQESQHYDFSLKYNKTVFDELGIEEPTSWDELRSALEVLKDEYGTQPMNLWWEGNVLFKIAGPSFDTIGGWDFIDGMMYDEEADEFYYAPLEQGYRDMVEFFAGLVEDGLLNPESFTQDDDMTEKQLVNMESFVSTGQALTMAAINESLEEAYGPDEYVFERMNLLDGPAGPKIGGARLASGVMFNADLAERDDLLAFLQFFDWLYYSEEGNEFAQWGIEGETFEKSDDIPGGYRPVDGLRYETFNTGAEGSLQEDYGFANVAFAFASNYELQLSKMDAKEIEFQQKMEETREKVPVKPAYPMSQADQEEAALLSTPLEDTVDQYTLRFITGQYSLDRWDEFIADLENQNVEAYVELVNEAYKSFQETLEDVE